MDRDHIPRTAAWSGAQFSDLPQVARDPPEVVSEHRQAPEAVHTTNAFLTAADGSNGFQQRAKDESGGLNATAQSQRVCGLAPRLFWALLIGAAVGGVVGRTLASRRASPSSTDSAGNNNNNTAPSALSTVTVDSSNTKDRPNYHCLSDHLHSRRAFLNALPRLSLVQLDIVREPRIAFIPVSQGLRKIVQEDRGHRGPGRHSDGELGQLRGSVYAVQLCQREHNSMQCCMLA